MLGHLFLECDTFLRFRGIILNFFTHNNHRMEFLEGQVDKSKQNSLLDYHFLLKTYSLLLASDHRRNFRHFKGFNDRILVVLNVREKCVVGSVASLLCILRI